MSTRSQVESIFFAALEKQTAKERAGYLDRACGDDTALRLRVERLLEAHPQAVDFLARPAVEHHGVASDENEDFRAANPPLRQIGDYRILREVGRGGMGVVYEAEQVSLGRRVALKVLPGQVSSDRMVHERFRREARAAARLHHTNIVPVYEVGQDGDVRFYAMQFIQGMGLDAVITELRRLRERGSSQSKIKASSEGQSVGPHGKHTAQGIEGPTLGEGVEVNPVLRYILTGRLDAGDRGPEQVGASPSMLATALAGGLATPTGAGTESRAGEFDPALTSTETGSATPGDTIGPRRLVRPHQPCRRPASPSSSSAILPGGTQLSSVESGRRGFFRSLAQIGRQVAGGLAYAHARGIVHRDIKPANLLLDTEGVVWIADFGLAKGEDEGLTHTGDIVGTLRYMSPERFRGEGDARADVYALGLTLYELLTLRPGFDSPDRLKLIEQIKTEEPKKPRAIDARIPRDLETIVLKAIEKDPKARYQSAEAMGEDLRRFLADEPIRARQVSAAERYWRWARCNPVIAVLGGVLTVVLIATTVGSMVAATYFRSLAGRESRANQKSQEARKAAIAAQTVAVGAARPPGARQGSAKRESRTLGALPVEHRRRVRRLAASEQRCRSRLPRRCAEGAPQLGMAVPPQPARRRLARAARAGREEKFDWSSSARRAGRSPSNAMTKIRFTCTTWPPAGSTPSSAVTRPRRHPWRTVTISSPRRHPWRTVLTASKLLPAATTRPSASGIRRRADKWRFSRRKSPHPTWIVTPA